MLGMNLFKFLVLGEEGLISDVFLGKDVFLYEGLDRETGILIIL
jgi:hypothetical protein